MNKRTTKVKNIVRFNNLKEALEWLWRNNKDIKDLIEMKGGLRQK